MCHYLSRFIIMGRIFRELLIVGCFLWCIALLCPMDRAFLARLLIVSAGFLIVSADSLILSADSLIVFVIFPAYFLFANYLVEEQSVTILE